MPESSSSLQQASSHLTLAQGVLGERRKLKQALKSTRKRLEQCILPSIHHAHQQRSVSTTAATAVTPAVCPSPADALIADLLAGLRALDSSRLSALHEPAVLDHLLAASDSDSDEEDDCRAVSMAAVSAPPAAVRTLPVPPTTQVLSGAGAPVSSNGSSALRQAVFGGAEELSVPEPLQGWDAFSEMQFAGAGRVLVCQGSKCQARGGLDVLRAVSELASGSPGIEVVPCKCVGKCKQGPAMRLRPQEAPCAVYTEVVPQRLPEIFAAHFSAPPPAACDHASGSACCVECKSGHVEQQQGPGVQVPALAVA